MEGHMHEGVAASPMSRLHDSAPETGGAEVTSFAQPLNVPRVFISYARKDGELAARDLRRRLVAGPPALTVWQDRAELEGGVGWWKQITDALDVVEFLVLVMTPAAQRSAMVQREWRYARQRGVCVYPVHSLAIPVDFSALPRWMRKAHFFEVEHEWDTLVAHLARPAVAKRVPFMAPDLPAGFVARPEVMSPLRHALLRATGEEVAITTALQGAGGLGKTTLAIALCHDEDVLEFFDDGILWVTLGNEPKVLDELAKVYVALSGRRPAFVDRDDAAYHLAQVLEERNCLIVIDDVWNPAHLKPFLRGGKGCVRLLTTRLSEIGPQARRFAIDTMNAAQATELLAKGLTVTVRDRPALRGLAKRLGEWPLLLELANAQLRRRVDKGEALRRAIAHAEERLQRDGVTAFDLRRAEQRQEAVARTMQLSLDLLDDRELEAFLQLAVFPEDVDIPLAVAGELWGLDAFEAEELAQLLDDISLTRLSLRTGSMRLHDLIRSYALNCVPDLPGAHRRMSALLPAAALASTDYAWRWLPFHLLQSGQREALRDLLDDPAWLLRKLHHTDVVALGEDFDLLNDDPESGLVQQALKLAAAVLAKNPAQLPGQLLGRLPAAPDRPRLQALRARAQEFADEAWLRPLRSLLTPSGSPNIATLVGHGAPVLCLALSDDAAFVVSGGADGSVRVWDWRRGRALAVMQGPPGRVLSVAISTDGEQVTSLGADQMLRLWDRRTGAARASVHLAEGPPRRVLAAPDSAAAWWVAAGWSVWAVAADFAMPLRPAARLPAPVLDLACSSDGALLSVCATHRLDRWGSDGATLLLQGSVRLPHLRCVAVAADASAAVTVGDDGALRGWSLAATSFAGVTDVVRAHDAFDVVRVAMDPQGRFALTADLNHHVSVWPLHRPSERWRLVGHAGPVNDVCVTPDAKRALSASDDGSLRVWDLTRAPVSKPAPAHVQPVQALALTPDARFGLSTADGRELLVWDCVTAKPCARHLGPGSWRIDGAAGEAWAVMLLAGGRLCCWPVRDKNLLVQGPEEELRTLQVDMADGTTLVVECGLRLSAWSGRPLQARLWLPIDERFAQALAFSDDGAHLAVLGTNGRLSQWRLTEVLQVQSLAAAPGALALSTGGRAMALAVGEGNVVLHRPDADPRLLQELHEGPVRDLAFARGEALLATCGEDASLRLWNTATGALHAAFTCESPLLRCAASADGDLFAAGDAAGQVHFFQLREPAVSSIAAAADGPARHR